MKLKLNTIRAFTLLEMSVVMAVIGLVAVGALISAGAWVQSSAYNSTTAKMDAIEQALLKFSVANKRIPCPSNLTCVAGQLNYGTEGNCGSATASCTTGTTGVNFLDTIGNAEGGVPTRALKLPDSYMYDAWGRRFRYATALRGTVAGGVPVTDALCDMGISVNDVTGASRSSKAIYALISHGANGHGAYTQSGAIVNGGSLNANEQTNCHCGSNGASSGTYFGQYVQQALSLNNTSGALYSFDDLVSYKEGWQMATPSTPVSSVGNCLYIGDGYWNTVRAVNSVGVISVVAGQWLKGDGAGCANACPASGCYSGAGGLATHAVLGSATGVGTDSSGNLYINDYCSHAILKVNAQTGIINAVIGPSGSGRTGPGPGSVGENILATAATTTWTYTSSPMIDSAGNIYFMDGNYSIVRKITATTGKVSLIGGVYGSTATIDSVHDGGPATAANFYNGAGGTQITLDSSGNIYLAEANAASVIRKITASTGTIALIAGNYNTIGSTNGGTHGATWGLFSGESALSFDNNGNLYIADYGNNVIREIYGTSNLMSTFSVYSGSHNSPTPTPQLASVVYFPTPTAMAADSSGNIYTNSGDLVIYMTTSNPPLATLVAGTGASGVAGNGVMATTALIQSNSIAWGKR